MERWIFISITSLFSPKTIQDPVHSQTSGTHASTAKSSMKQSRKANYNFSLKNTTSCLGFIACSPSNPTIFPPIKLQ